MDELEKLKQQNHDLKVIVASQMRIIKQMHESLISALDGEGPTDPDDLALVKAALSPVPIGVDMALKKLADKGIFPADSMPPLNSCL